jgi:hypothetical protein
MCGPENEVDDPLCPAKQNGKRPNSMPPADQRADGEADLVWIRYQDVIRLLRRACECQDLRGTLWAFV